MDNSNITGELQFLNVCRDIELLNEQLYRRFARQFSYDRELSELWSKTANEEANHAQQFEFAIRMKKEMLAMLDLDEKEVVAVLNFVRNALQMSEDNPPDTQEALHLGIKLEQRLAKMHLGCIATFTDESFKKLFKSMMDFDNGHLESLIEARGRYSKA